MKRMAVQTDAKPLPLEAPKRDPFLGPNDGIKRIEKISVEKGQKDLEQFTERQDLLQAPFEYARNGSDPGLVLIFNHESFENKTYRMGSRRDVNEIITCMSRLGFNVSLKHIFTDLDRKELEETIETIVSQDLSRVNSLVVFFLTHGDDYNTLYTRDVSIKTHEIWEAFGKCEHLKNKPKIFIFQACKGGSISTTSDAIQEKIELIPEKTFQTQYIGPDMLIVYSTVEGSVSFRDPKTGTWFIQELCKNFSAYGRRDDIISLLIRTTKCLSRNYYLAEGQMIKKQMPVFISTLRKKFYLNRSKDRNMWMKFLQDQQAMAERITDLEKKVSDLVLDKDKKSK